MRLRGVFSQTLSTHFSPWHCSLRVAARGAMQHHCSCSAIHWLNLNLKTCATGARTSVHICERATEALTFLTLQISFVVSTMQ